MSKILIIFLPNAIMQKFVYKKAEEEKIPIIFLNKLDIKLLSSQQEEVSYAPYFLSTFTFEGSPEEAELLEAIKLIRELNAKNLRKVPEDAPIGFVPQKWLPYVEDENNNIDRHYYELCVLWELRNALRAGNIWLSKSRRYANPETYLISKNRWPELRSEVCRQIEAPQDGTIRLSARYLNL